jgi:hypothetical protein
MAIPQTQTLVKNISRRRRLTYLPPNGKVLGHNETCTIHGILEDILYLGKDISGLATFYSDIANSRIEVTKVGYGEGCTPGHFIIIIGDGANTVFDIDAGFDTALSQIYLYDLLTFTPIDFYMMQRETPDPTSIRLTLTPAPALNSIQVFIFQ